MQRVRDGPNVLQIHDFFEDKRAFYIVCELCAFRDAVPLG